MTKIRNHIFAWRISLFGAPVAKWLIFIFSLTVCINNASAAELCGWLVNRGTADIYILSSQGRFNIAEEGYDADGSRNVGDLAEVEDEGFEYRQLDHGGYFCACISASIQADEGRIVDLHRVQNRPLEQCDGMAELDTPF